MSPPSSPRRGCRPPPALDDDALSEIFLRIPPEDPKTLVRASAVCTTWRRILSVSDDDAFARLYRAFHGAPPMLGFLHNTTPQRKGRNSHRGRYMASNFVSTASFRPPACHERRRWHAIDSRHGLVLFHTPNRAEDFVICDLVTYDRWRIQARTVCVEMMITENGETRTWNAVVLCAKDRCDHLYCHGGPFLVAVVACNKWGRETFASVYSSKTGEWSHMIRIQETHVIDMAGHVAVVGDTAYFQCKNADTILGYNMAEQQLSLIHPPFDEENQDLPYPLLMAPRMACC